MVHTQFLNVCEVTSAISGGYPRDRGNRQPIPATYAFCGAATRTEENPLETVDSRTLPVYSAGAVEVPFVIAGMDELVSRETRWDAHSHPTHELLWNERGASSATVGSRTWTITPTVGLWMPAGVLHSAIAPAGTWYRAAQLDIASVPSLSDVPVAIEVTPLLRNLLERLADDSLGTSSRSLTEQMVIDVLAPSPNELLVLVPDSPLLQPIVDAIGDDPSDMRTLSDWARLLGVSPRTITRVFRSETGMSFGQWVSAVRAQRAVTLLAHGLDLQEVAERVGYHSTSAFGAAFRRTTGATPGMFRAS
ncbi:helix-turn-helix domain-containing protein [Rhodococcus qingshengii]|uniref:helix-turn-helix domain-containing protein n=1 Tax=Rhodococcus qingshengii TaxID=334542 RepID=UPI0009F437E0|nr:AraC family transcriptional regulator [Rhodococcus qingshengii]